MFQHLYYEICYLAHRKVYSTDELAQAQCEKIGNCLHDLFEYMKVKSYPSAEVHNKNLELQTKYWGWLQSNKTCFVCIRRSPEHVLPCGHSICDICVKIFGCVSVTREEEYIVSRCNLCGAKQSLTVRIKPVTCAARVLSIDGGGPRGIIPLENLEIMQQFLGPQLPLCDMIDLTVGCSSGGLIALSKFILRLDITSCKNLFQDLAKKVLSPAKKKRLLRSWLSDGLYNADTLEDSLRDHYTATRRMFDTPQDLISAGKVAVSASEIQAGAPFIFTNYNGSAPHRAQSGLIFHFYHLNLGLIISSLRKASA